jgi:hypothetical protein
MKKFSLCLILLIGFVPLAACNQQNSNRAPGIHQRHERGMFGQRRAGGGGRGRFRQACADDVAKYCSGMNRPRLLRQCLQSHLDQVSADCKTTIENFGGGGRRRRGF